MKNTTNKAISAVVSKSRDLTNIVSKKTRSLWAQPKAVRALFILSFAALGGAGVYFTQAATADPLSVRFVVLCASNSCDTTNVKVSTVQTRAEFIQDWYAKKLGKNKEFNLLPTERITTPNHSLAWYKNNQSGYISSETLLKRIYDNRSNLGLNKANTKTVIILGFNERIATNCGVGDSGYHLSIVEPKKTDCATFQTSVYAHELGHNFTLSHTNDNNLMHGFEYACNKKTLGKCALGQTSLDHLLKYYNGYTSKWFWKSASPTASASVVDPDEALATTTPTPTVSPVMLYKYYNESSIDNLYSTDRNDPAKSSYGYSYQGCVAQIMPTQVSGTIPVYRYFNSANNGAFGGDTLLTGTRDDAGMGNYGYGYVGLVGYIFTSQQAGTVPLKQYFAGAPKTDHFYTTEAWTSGFLDYNYEVSLGYVYPPPADKCGPTDPVPASPNKTVLHHYYNSATIDNFYTVNFNELGYGSDQYGHYKYYGCKAIVWDRQVPGSTPLWRYWNGTGGDHFYTVDRNDAGYAGYGYGIESVEGYVFRDGRVGGTGAFNRYFAGYPKTDHYYTMDAWTNGFLDYYFERTEAYTYRCG